jgi:large subunit ribosomal protein L31
MTTGGRPCGRHLELLQNMKPNTHPKYQQAKVHCASCKSEFEIGSTRAELRMDVCSSCHPFFTGKQIILDTAGQVERFQRRLERAERA